MRLKTDENLGLRVVEMLRQAGHDVRSVVHQGIQGAPDQKVIDLCHRENGGLVTMDLEFGNPLVFKPSDYSGIAILRLPRGSTPDELSGVVHTLVIGLAQGEIGGKLWIVQRGRIRQYQEQDDNY